MRVIESHICDHCFVPTLLDPAKRPPFLFTSTRTPSTGSRRARNEGLGEALQQWQHDWAQVCDRESPFPSPYCHLDEGLDRSHLQHLERRHQVSQNQSNGEGPKHDQKLYQEVLLLCLSLDVSKYNFINCYIKLWKLLSLTSFKSNDIRNYMVS